MPMERVARWTAGAAEGVLLASVVLAPWPYGSATEPARYALAAILLLAGTLWAAGLALRGQGLPALALPAVGLPLLALSQALLGLSVAPTWTIDAVLVLTAMLAVTVLVSDRAGDRDAAQRLAWAVLVACAAQAVFGAVQWSMGPGRIYGRATPIVTMPFGSFVNHNHFAGLLEMGVALAVGLALGHAGQQGGPTPRSIALGGLALGLAAAHLASRSRGGVLALAGGLAVLALAWVMAARRGRAVAAGLAGAGALGVLAFGLAVIPQSSRQHLASVLSGPSDLSGEYRVDMARATLDLAVSRPLLGSGLGAYADAVPAFKRAHGNVRTTHAESDVLELLAEGGLAGLLLVVWFALGSWRGLADRLANGRDPWRKGLAVGALAGVVALLAHSLVDFNLRIPSNALAFAILLGLASSPRTDPPRLGRRWPAGILAALLAVAAGTSAWRSLGALELERALARTAPQLRMTRLDRALARHSRLAEAWRARADTRWEVVRGGGAGTEGRLAAVESDLRRALALRPAWGEAWADLAILRIARGDRLGSREALDRALRLDPTHREILRLRDVLREGRAP
jgi:O-antigen ligase